MVDAADTRGPHARASDPPTTGRMTGVTAMTLYESGSPPERTIPAPAPPSRRGTRGSHQQGTRQTDAGPRQAYLLTPEPDDLLRLARETLALLRDLALHYEVARLGPPQPERRVTSPADIAAYLGPELRDLAQEQLRVVQLDTKHHILGTALVYQGGVNAAVITMADCFREAVRTGAVAIILVHNHPSFDCTPSPEDVQVTKLAARAGAILGIAVLDHIVIGGDTHVSLRVQGLYQPLNPTASDDASGSDPSTAAG